MRPAHRDILFVEGGMELFTAINNCWLSLSQSIEQLPLAKLTFYRCFVTYLENTLSKLRRSTSWLIENYDNRKPASETVSLSFYCNRNWMTNGDNKRKITLGPSDFKEQRRRCGSS